MRKIVIAGAGPAGLTAARELLRKGFLPVVLESSQDIGGISRTVVYKGNRMDIGGHRFFSKSERVMDWWQSVLPLQGAPSRDELERKTATRLSPDGPDPERTDDVMLVRSRLSRILFLRKFFPYPITLSARTLFNLGPARVGKILLSYLSIKILPKRTERSLEDFFINRFGVELYRTFFRDYTEKVWGVPCDQIKPEWGAQRIKGLSIIAALKHALRSATRPRDLAQKDTETSLIEEFLYPKLGPGQLWEKVADEIRREGGEILLGHEVQRLETEDGKIVTVVASTRDGEVRLPCEAFFSSMPVQDLVRALPQVPQDIREVSEGLVYRDFVTVGLLLDKLHVLAAGSTPQKVPDNWIYVQESDVRLGRIQIFNNWSSYLVSDPSKVWIGLEYFCQENDGFWNLSDEQLKATAIGELEKIGFASGRDVLDGTVVRVKKTYPAYFGAYERFPEIRAHLDSIPNLYCIGRNGQHRYNNQDHSMLSAMEAVEAFASGNPDKSGIWSINAEAEYHESK